MVKLNYVDEEGLLRLYRETIAKKNSTNFREQARSILLSKIIEAVKEKNQSFLDEHVNNNNQEFLISNLLDANHTAPVFDKLGQKIKEDKLQLVSEVLAR